MTTARRPTLPSNLHAAGVWAVVFGAAILAYKFGSVAIIFAAAMLAAAGLVYARILGKLAYFYLNPEAEQVKGTDQHGE